MPGSKVGWEKTGERRLAKQKLQVPPTKSDPAQEKIKYDATV
jgi:hypothetical protein